MTTAAVLACIIGLLAYKAVRVPSIALVGVFCMYGLEQWAQANSRVFIQNSTLINFLIAVVVGVGLLSRYFRSLRSGDRLTEAYPVVGALVGLLAFYAFITTMWTTDRVDTSSIWLGAMPYWLVAVASGPFLFSNTRELSQAYTYQIAFGGIVAALLYFGAEWQGRVIVLDEETISTTTRGQGNPLATAQMAGVTLICAAFAAASFRGHTLLRMAVAAICLLVIVRSGSRGQLIGLALAIAVAFPLRYSIQHAKVFAVTALGSLAGVALVLYGLATFWEDAGRFSGVGASEDYAERIEMAGGMLSVWLSDTRAVIFGLGNSTSYDPRLLGSYPHVVPIEILTEEGLIGALLYLFILVLVFNGVMRSIRRGKAEPDSQSALAVSVAIVIYMFLISLKQGNLLGSTSFFMSVIMLGKVSALIYRFQQVDVVDNRKIARSPTRHSRSIRSAPFTS